MDPVVVVIGREAAQAVGGRIERPEDPAVEQLRLEDPQQRWSLPFVQGEFTWVRRCRMRSDSRVLPKRVRTPGIQTTNGLPLSLISSSGVLHRSTQSSSQARIGWAWGLGRTRRPMRTREWSSTRPTIQTFSYSRPERRRKNRPLMSMCHNLVGPAALVRRATFVSDRRSGRPKPGQQVVDGVVVERVDLAAGELGRQALRVPVRQQADHDDRLLDPRGQPCRPRTARSIDERIETTGLVADAPAMNARPADPELEGGRDTLLPRDAHRPGP